MMDAYISSVDTCWSIAKLAGERGWHVVNKGEDDEIGMVKRSNSDELSKSRTFCFSSALTY